MFSFRFSRVDSRVLPPMLNSVHWQGPWPEGPTSIRFLADRERSADVEAGSNDFHEEVHSRVPSARGQVQVRWLQESVPQRLVSNEDQNRTSISNGAAGWGEFEAFECIHVLLLYTHAADSQKPINSALDPNSNDPIVLLRDVVLLLL